MNNLEAIKFELLSKSNINKVIDCIVEVFPSKEPITSILNVGVEEFKPFASSLVTYALGQNLSWVAISKITGEIVGARIVTDWKNDFISKDGFGRKMDTISNFLEKVSSHAIKEKFLVGNNVIHPHIVAVKSQYEGIGIAKKLLKLGSVHAMGLGYNYSIGEVTSKYNKKILSRVSGYKEIFNIAYSDYLVDGVYPFSGLREHEACTLFIIDLEKFSRDK